MRLLVVIILAVVLIAGCIQTSVIAKPRYYCDNNNVTVCNDLIKNCTDSIIVQESSSEDMMSFNVTNEKDNCILFISINKISIADLKGTSMTCNIPIINGKLKEVDLAKNLTTYCKGSYVDRLLQETVAQPTFTASTSRGFSTLAVLQPWSLSSNGNFQVTLENRVGAAITLNKIYIMSTDDSTASIGTPSPKDFEAGQKQFVTATLSGNAIPSTAKTGDTYSLIVAIEYIYSGSYFNSTGTLSSTYS